MAVRVGINGFGRIGRSFYRAILARGEQASVELVAVNDPFGDAHTMAFLLKHDSVGGTLKNEIKETDNGFSVDGREVKKLEVREPSEIPWGDNGVDVVIESTGLFTARDKAAAHHTVISNASCTTNCLAPLAKVLHDHFGIEQGLINTVHAYTSDQQLLDGPHKDYRRARAAACNLVPTTTGAAKALGLVVPALAGRLHGYAVRVPVPTGSLVDLTLEVERPTTIEEVNAIARDRADRGELAGLLAYSEEPLVSSDIVKSSFSSIFDSGLTAVVDGTQVKVVAWYDNEWGYSNRLVELAQRVLVPAPAGV